MELKFITVLTYTLGFLSQILFFGRTIIQWFQSEKAGKVLSPVLFWQLSLIASMLLLVYGILRKDFAIILGQALTYFIYIRNLQLQNAWKKIPSSFRVLTFILPFASFAWIIFSGQYNIHAIFYNNEIAQWLLYFGIGSQIIFPIRFIYQWLIAEKQKESTLPLGFWFLSLFGGIMTVVYAIFRKDPVLFIGNFGGLIMYSRNIILHYTEKGIFDLLPFDIQAIRQRFKRSTK